MAGLYGIVRDITYRLLNCSQDALGTAAIFILKLKGLVGGLLC